MDDLYRENILEHYKRPHHWGELEDPDMEAFDTNPLCQSPDGTYTNVQRFSKGLPGTRQISVLRDLGAQGVLASICAQTALDAEQPTFGYKPAVDAVLRALRPRLADGDDGG